MQGCRRTDCESGLRRASRPSESRDPHPMAATDALAASLLALVPSNVRRALWLLREGQDAIDSCIVEDAIRLLLDFHQDVVAPAGGARPRGPIR